MGSVGFYERDGAWFCDDIQLSELREELEKNYERPTPVVVYSKKKLKENLQAYRVAAASNVEVGYSMKANNCLGLLKIIAKHTDRVITVSGYEIQMALRAGFKPEKIIFNGNGKERWEIDLALTKGCLLNVDSEFDARHIVQAAEKLAKTVDVFVRVNPALDPQVHPYISTGLADSKFGVEMEQLEKVFEILRSSPKINLVGLHCHLGSTIKNVKVYEDVARVLNDLGVTLRKSTFPNLKYLNIGGGLGIDYTGQDVYPTPGDVYHAVNAQILSGFTVILEPGRSIIGNTGALLVDVVGIKKNGSKHFAVVNGAMNDLIRPSLYSAFHRIAVTANTGKLEVLYDVVGPVCESGDFLGKERLLPQIVDGDTLVVLDCGAYGSAMASNYNMRGKSMEILVDGREWSVLRHRESLDDLMSCMTKN